MPVIHLLGTPHLELGSGRTHALERKDAALLALVALEGGVSAAHAAGLLWPDSPDAQARANLRQRLFRLRRLAATDLVRPEGGALRLAPDPAVDLLCFDGALADDPEAGSGDLLGGLDYGGTGALEDWVGAARQRWRERRSDRIAARASTLEAAGQIAAAIVLAQRLLADDPLREHAHRRLMRLHYLRGDRAAALAAFERCRAVLRSELGVQPDAETLQLAAVVQASSTLTAAGSGPRPPSLLRPPRLIGRERPWARLEQALHGGGPVLVEGEAGIGKTRLLADFAAAHGGMPVFGGRPGDAQLPYALLARIVRGLTARWPQTPEDWVAAELARIAPEWGPAAPGPLAPLRLQQALQAALAAWQAAGLVMLVVDDLHHADDATVELLPALAGALRSPPLRWLLGARSAELPPAMRQWIDAPDGVAVDRIALGPLDGDAVRALIVSMALPGFDADAWAPRLARHTGGHPLYLLETLIALDVQSRTAAEPPSGDGPALPTPERIGRLIERRLAQLSPPALRLARVAAVAGQDFSAALAAQVLGQHALDIADGWRELEAAQVIRGDTFAHDLVHDSTLRSIPQPIARLLHHDVAVALQAAAAPPARLAAHWAAAEDWAAAGRAHMAAARAAFDAARRTDEAACWDQAVACFERAGDAARAFEARVAGVEAALATRPAHGVAAQTATLLADAASDGERFEALLAHAKSLQVADRRHDAASAVDEALALATASPDPWAEFRAACAGALVHAPGPRAAEAIERLRRFAPQLAAAGTPAQQRDFHVALVYALHVAGRRGEALALYPQAIDAARAVGDTHEELVCTANLSGLLGHMGRVEAARTQAERACRLLERIGDPDGATATSAHIALALLDLLSGRIGPAIDGFEQAWQRAGAAGGTSHHMVCENHLANCWLQLGQPARALQALRPVAAGAAMQVSQRPMRRLAIEARIDRALGKPAAPRLAQALALHGPGSDPMLRQLVELDASREQPPATAIAVCQRVRDEAATMALLGVAMRARVLLIEALHRDGQGAEAVAAVHAAAAEWGHCRPADLYWPEALWLAQRALHDAGDATAAAALRAQAVQWIVEVASPHVPAPFHDSFIHRNPVNRALLTAARDLGP